MAGGANPPYLAAPGGKPGTGGADASKSGTWLNLVEYRRFTRSDVASLWGARSFEGADAAPFPGPFSGFRLLAGAGSAMGFGALI